MRLPSAGGPSVYSVPPPFNYPHLDSEPSLPPSSPVSRRYGCYMPFDSPRPATMSPPLLRPTPPMSPPPSAPTMSPSQTESVVGSMHRRRLSTITERTSPSSAIPPPPAFGRTPANGPSPSTSSIETFSTPSCVILNPPTVPQSRFSVSTGPRTESTAQSGGHIPPWLDVVYPRYSAPSIASTDDYTIPSPRSVEVPNLRPAPADNNIRCSLFPSVPVVVERQSQESGLLLRSDTPEPEESVSSPMSSPTRSVLSYATSTFFANYNPSFYTNGISQDRVYRLRSL
jgi:hypothetical protein